MTDVLGVGTHMVGILDRQIVWGEGPWREENMLRVWEMVLVGKTYVKRPRCGNSNECKGRPVSILTEWGVFNTRLAHPEKGGLRGTLTEEMSKDGCPQVRMVSSRNF